jgi:hypothetical protein
VSELQGVIANSLRQCVREDGQGFNSIIGTIQHFFQLRGLDPPSNIDAVASVVVVAVEEYMEKHNDVQDQANASDGASGQTQPAAGDPS